MGSYGRIPSIAIQINPWFPTSIDNHDHCPTYDRVQSVSSNDIMIVQVITMRPPTAVDGKVYLRPPPPSTTWLSVIVVSSFLKQTSTVQSHKYSAVLPLLTRLSQHYYECRATLFLSPPQHDLCCTISSFSSIGNTCGTSATSSCPTDLRHGRLLPSRNLLWWGATPLNPSTHH